MDLLGASEFLRTLNDEQLGHLLGSIRANVDLFDQFPAYEGPARVVTFSDNVAAALPLDSRESDGGLGWQVLAAGSFQLNLAFNGFLARGGITIGPVYADDNTVLGQALVRAYELESKVAQFPRVVLDPQCLALFARGALDYRDPRTSLQNQIALVDPIDGLVFVHFLEFVWEADNEGEALECLQRHRDLLTAGLEQHTGNTAVLPKYQWAADYHDWSCKSFGRDKQSVGHREVPVDRFVPLIDYLEEALGERVSRLASAPWERVR